MKRIIAEGVLLLLACLGAVSASAQIQEGIVIRDQWMTGSVMACFEVGSASEHREEILVDCPLPQAEFTDEILTLSSRNIGKRDVLRALHAAGQNDSGKIIAGRDGVGYICTEQIDPFADITREEAERQAVEIGLAYFSAMGVDVIKTPSSIARPYDYDAYIQKKQEQLEHMYDDTTVMMERAKAQWKRMNRYEMREAAYTRVEFDILVQGMRIWRNPSYPAGYADEPDAWNGFEVKASVLISDSGVIVEAWASHVPEIISRRQPEEGELERFAALLDAQLIQPLVLAQSWEEALELALSGTKQTAGIGGNQTDHPYQNQDMAKPITAYGSRSVITNIYPCLTTISENEWAMFWRIESRQEFADGWRY